MQNFKAGRQVWQGSYRCFLPEELNRSWTLDNMEVIGLLSRADRHLGRLDMYSEYIPNIDLFISMHKLKEATQSSKIEGTKTNIEEALKEREALPLEQRDDWDEVNNYTRALNAAIDQLSELPLSSRLIRDTHKLLLQGVRGKYKTPGEFRASQNWIGGATLQDATFIPPPHTEVGRLMSDLEKFAHSDKTRLPDLIKIALIHYQFETIHPFLDGNGRVGRLLVTLYLVEKGILRKPVLYLSDFFERHRQLYYQNLTAVREENKISQWLKFFLVGVNETAQDSVKTLDGILKLQKETDQKLQVLGARTQGARDVVNYLYKQPLVDAHQVSKILNQSLPSSYTLLKKLVQLGILQETARAKRGKQYLFQSYLDLFR
jgi:Fic family protein